VETVGQQHRPRRHLARRQSRAVVGAGADRRRSRAVHGLEVNFMKIWKPKHFKPEWPLAEDGCAFVLGGTLDGEIIQWDSNLMPIEFRKAIAAPMRLERATGFVDPSSMSFNYETYHREELRFGEGRRIYFYMLEGQDMRDRFIRAFTALAMHKREALA